MTTKYEKVHIGISAEQNKEGSWLIRGMGTSSEVKGYLFDRNLGIEYHKNNIAKFKYFYNMEQIGRNEFKLELKKRQSKLWKSMHGYYLPEGKEL